MTVKQLSERVQMKIESTGGNGARRGTIVVEGLSANNNLYTAEALASGVEIFEGAKMFADHPTMTEREEKPARSVRDLVGRVNNPKAEKRGESTVLTADFFISESAQWLSTLVDEGIVTDVSLSAVVEGDEDEDGRFVVSRFVSPTESPNTPAPSVDFVTYGAAGGKVSESMQKQFLNALTVQMLQEARPDLVKREETPPAPQPTERVNPPMSNNRLAIQIVEACNYGLSALNNLSAQYPEQMVARVRTRISTHNTTLEEATSVDMTAYKAAVDAIVKEETDYYHTIAPVSGGVVGLFVHEAAPITDERHTALVNDVKSIWEGI